MYCMLSDINFIYVSYYRSRTSFKFVSTDKDRPISRNTFKKNGICVYRIRASVSLPVMVAPSSGRSGYSTVPPLLVIGHAFPYCSYYRAMHCVVYSRPFLEAVEEVEKGVGTVAGSPTTFIRNNSASALKSYAFRNPGLQCVMMSSLIIN
jgi:hypothetical protein